LDQNYFLKIRNPWAKWSKSTVGLTTAAKPIWIWWPNKNLFVDGNYFMYFWSWKWREWMKIISQCENCTKTRSGFNPTRKTIVCEKQTTSICLILPLSLLPLLPSCIFKLIGHSFTQKFSWSTMATGQILLLKG
jgi:hypothetical protein